jgi:lysophospholipase L1-like esterase
MCNKKLLHTSLFSFSSCSFSTLSAFAGIFFTLIFFSNCNAQTKSFDKSDMWVGTWSTAEQLVEPRNLPPEPGLSDNTLRQVVHVSIGGDSLRVKFSNNFSSNPVTMKSVHIAVSLNSSAIDIKTDKSLSFDGNSEITIELGNAVTSDPFGFSLKPGSNVTITIYYGETSPDVTGHPGSRTTSYIVPGNEVTATNFTNAAKTDHWYTINGVDVVAPENAAAVAVLGNSITDGRGSGTNKQNRWPDELAKRLRENPATQEVAVLNEGIGGNCVLRGCLGPSAISRFDRDILNQSGIRWLIILEGINDIGGSRGAEGADRIAKGLIEAYEKMIDLAHAKGIRVYGATMTPFGGSFYDSPDHQRSWETVNNWIRTSGRFDAVIDLAKAISDPNNPTHLIPAGDSGDHLHPNEAGHRMMAEAVELNLFKLEENIIDKN